MSDVLRASGILNSRRFKNFNKYWGNVSTFATYNIHNFGFKKADSKFNCSHCKYFSHGAFCVTETWNSQRHFEFWNCVTCAENTFGKDRPSGVCIIPSDKFAVKQGNRGKLGTRGCWVRTRGPVFNVLIIGVYLSPNHSRAACIELIRVLRELLENCSEHDCIILLGDFNVHLPRNYGNVTGQFSAERSAAKRQLSCQVTSQILP